MYSTRKKLDHNRGIFLLLHLHMYVLSKHLIETMYEHQGRNTGQQFDLVLLEEEAATAAGMSRVFQACPRVTV